MILSLTFLTLSDLSKSVAPKIVVPGSGLIASFDIRDGHKSNSMTLTKFYP